MRQIDICELILTGHENAISMRDLSELMGVPARVVRREILKARLAGNLIISDDAGYYLPANDDEIKSFVRRTSAGITTSQAMIRPFVRELIQHN